MNAFFLPSLWMLFLALASTALVPSIAGAATPVTGPITSDTAWTKAEGPYVVSADVAVVGGVRLTFEPGAVVRFQQDRTLTVRGTLTAAGTTARLAMATGFTAGLTGSRT